jgi:hypothetical protein
MHVIVLVFGSWPRDIVMPGAQVELHMPQHATAPCMLPSCWWRSCVLNTLPFAERPVLAPRVLADVRGKDEPARSHRYLNKDHQSRIATKEIATTGTSTLQASMGSSSSKREEFHLKDLCVRHRYCDSLTVDATGECYAQQQLLLSRSSAICHHSLHLRSCIRSNRGRVSGCPAAVSAGTLLALVELQRALGQWALHHVLMLMSDPTYCLASACLQFLLAGLAATGG